MTIPKRYTSNFELPDESLLYQSGAINYMVEALNGIKYLFFANTNSDPVFSISLDGGMTWGTPTVLKNMTITQIAVWYDRWSGINSDLIHVVYTDFGARNVYYRTIDTANNNALGTEYTVFDGASTATFAAISISRMRGGNLICVGMIDAGVELYAKKSVDIGANWTNIAAVMEGAVDHIIMMPGWGADNQDGMAFYYDYDASEISVKYYDDSADSWSETSIATSIVLPEKLNRTGHTSAVVDITNSQNILVFWTALDTANADLRCFKVTQSTQTEVTNVVLNSVDDQGFCGICIDTNTQYWYCLYGGKSDGTQIYPQVSFYYKISTDQGSTWGAETSTNGIVATAYAFMVSPRFKNSYNYAVQVYGTVYYLYINAQLSIPHLNYQIGI